MWLEKTRELIEQQKRIFKQEYGLNLTLNMMAMITGLSEHSIRCFGNFSEKAMEKHYNMLKEIDFTKFINKELLHHK